MFVTAAGSHDYSWLKKNTWKVNEVAEVLKSEPVWKQKSGLSIYKVWFCTGVVLQKIGKKLVETSNSGIVRNFQLAVVNQI